METGKSYESVTIFRGGSAWKLEFEDDKVVLYQDGKIYLGGSGIPEEDFFPELPC